MRRITALTCLALAAVCVPAAARCAEGARALAERMAVSLTDWTYPAEGPPAFAASTSPRARDPFALTSELAPSVFHGAKDVPELWLAQRTIDRDWGLSEDSTYHVVDVPGWKSEGWAMMMSGALPGTGQLYVGESSGWLFLAAEVVGWTGHFLVRDRAQSLSNDAANFVGDPTDSLSTWSFARYAAATGAPATQMETLWHQDRDAFYQALSTDTRFNAGFAGPDPSATYGTYQGIRQSSQDRFKQVHYLDVALLLNHVVSAWDALRAARAHNLPFQKNVDLKLAGGLSRGQPTFHATLTRRF
jgi:hypothetical protein